MSNRFWFKPKVFGYGATPITWEGWAVVTGYCAVIAIATFTAMLLIELRGDAAWLHWVLWGVWALLLLASTVILTVATKRRTDGEWRWRWGRRANEWFGVQRTKG